MARGWESKSVEDQINARETAQQGRAKSASTPQQKLIQSKRDALLLQRTRIESQIRSARNDTYRQQLELALAHLDSELAKLDLS